MPPLQPWPRQQGAPQDQLGLVGRPGLAGAGPLPVPYPARGPWVLGTYPPGPAQVSCQHPPRPQAAMSVGHSATLHTHPGPLGDTGANAS